MTKKSSWFCNFCTPTHLFQPPWLLERWEYVVWCFFLLLCPENGEFPNEIIDFGSRCVDWRVKKWSGLGLRPISKHCTIVDLELVGCLKIFYEILEFAVLDSAVCNKLLSFQDFNTDTTVPKVESVQQKNKLKLGLYKT